MRANSYGALEGAVDVSAAACFDAARPHKSENIRGYKMLALTWTRTRGMTPPKGE